MHRVDVVADPDPRVGEADLGAAEVAGERLEREPLRRPDLLQLQRPGALERPPLEPRLDQVVVVVARDHDHLASRERLAERRQRRGRAVEHLAQRAVAKLEHVAEQDQPVGAGELGAQTLAESLAAQQIGAAAEPEMEVGDDRRAHGAIVAAAT